MNKKSIIIIILLIIIFMGFIFLIGFEKNQSKEKNINSTVSANDDSSSIVADADETSDDDNNKGYEIPNFEELSETEKFFNSGYIISMKSYLRVNQILNMNIDEINKTKKEIEEFEEAFKALEITEDTRLAERILEELFVYGYEAIDLYSRRLNGEEIKSIMIHDKITKAQEKYFAYAEEFDKKKIPMSKEVIKEVIEIREEINQKLKEIQNR